MTRPRDLFGAAMAILAVGLLGLSACNRPSEASCKKAIANVAKIMGTADDKFAEKPDSAIRSCRGNATKKDVRCMIKAKSEQDLIACEGGVFDKLFGKDIKKRNEERAKKEAAKKNAPTPEPSAAPAVAPDTPAAAPDKPAVDKPAVDKPAPAKPAPAKPAPAKPAPDKPAPDKKADAPGE